MQTVYIDVLFLMNFFIDYVIIVTTAFVCGREHNSKRILSASAAGALYSVIIFFPQLKIFNIMILKLLMSIVIITISFKFHSIRSHFKLFITYYVVNFIYGGGIYAFYRFTNIGSKMNYSNGEYYIDIPLGIIIILTLLIYFLTLFIAKTLNQKTDNIKKIRIFLNNKYIDATALIDTGNKLYDPMSMTPVSLIENKTAVKLFGTEINDEIFKQNKMRIVPWRDASGDSKTIYAFKPSKIVIQDSMKELNEMLLGIADNNFTSDDSYQVLLHSNTVTKE